MNVVLVHNHYQQPGGEDQVFAAEASLLEGYGHTVTRYTIHNDLVRETNRLALIRDTIWNSNKYHELRSLFRGLGAKVVHVHNTLPLISPSVYYAAHAEGAAVVQTLHNYRLTCVNGLLFRNGHVCEDCLGKVVPWPGIFHACYRGHRGASSVVAAMLGYHKLRGTYQNEVDHYIALTEFSRQKYIEMGIPAERLTVKPNFVYPDPGKGSGSGGYALFVGRLSEEKGVPPLLAAWEVIGAQLPLKIVGDGPLLNASDAPNIEWLGRQPREVVLKLMREAVLLVFPSVWYEGFPMTIVEAFASGTPVLASSLGSMATIVEHRRTGLHFTSSDSQDLVSQVQWALGHPQHLAKMRLEARTEYEAKYKEESNYRTLLEVYTRALRTYGGRRT